jgi:hypothetical protein
MPEVIHHGLGISFAHLASRCQVFFSKVFRHSGIVRLYSILLLLLPHDIVQKSICWVCTHIGNRAIVFNFEHGLNHDLGIEEGPLPVYQDDIGFPQCLPVYRHTVI